MQYLDFDEAASLARLSRTRLEQLLRDPAAGLPQPFQPYGAGGHRVFRHDELIAWLERRRAAYSQKGN